MARQLTDKQISFVRYFILNGGNGTDAARSARYKGNANQLGSIAAENLLKPAILELIEVERKETSDKFEITRESQLKGLQYARDIAMNTLKRKDLPLFNEFFRALDMQNKMLGFDTAEKEDPNTEPLEELEACFGE